MGRIKSKLIKRTGNILLNEENNFNDDFNTNKKVLKNSMPSKKIRNQVAGFITRKKRKPSQ
ncbi:MAG: 30S ribosomal protein S17e [archaeon]